MSSQQLYIRPARPSDSSALSRICLLTGDAGGSAEHLHTFGELVGVMYAEPYVHFPSCAAGFVLVDRLKHEDEDKDENEKVVEDSATKAKQADTARTTKSDIGSSSGARSGGNELSGEEKEEEEGEVIVGYILTAFDTSQFEKKMEEDWLPKYRTKYPLPVPNNPDTPTSIYSSSPPPKDADIRFINLIHQPHHASPAALAYSPAHMHIDILKEYQRRGFGKKLIGTLVKWLKEEKGLERLWLGMDPRNGGAKRFYDRLGFKAIEGAPEGVVGLEFKDWKD